MASSLNKIADMLTQCKREFAVQLLENTNASLSQLASLDSCATDVTVVSRCIGGGSTATTAGSTVTAAPAPAPEASPDTSMADEAMTEACAASLSGATGSTANATGASCPSSAAARVVAGMMPLTTNSLGAGSMMMVVPPAASDASSVLEISGSNTRGAITWRAMCWCDDTWDPVCDAATRKQYPNTCSAQCQVREGEGTWKVLSMQG